MMRKLAQRPAPRFIACTRARLCSTGAVASRKELSALLCAGGDSRLHLTARGTNKYFCAPEPASGPAVLRSSCTCSPPSAVGFSHALDKWHELEAARGGDVKEFEQAFGGAMESVRERISRALELPEGTAVVLSASGTDAEYVPLAIARELALLEQALH